MNFISAALCVCACVCVCVCVRARARVCMYMYICTCRVKEVNKRHVELVASRPALSPHPFSPPSAALTALTPRHPHPPRCGSKARGEHGQSRIELANHLRRPSNTPQRRRLRALGGHVWTHSSVWQAVCCRTVCLRRPRIRKQAQALHECAGLISGAASVLRARGRVACARTGACAVAAP